MTFSFGYQILNCSTLRMITLSAWLKIALKNSLAAIDWFVSNEMIVNLNKLQAIVVKRNNKMKDSYPINLNQNLNESK